MCPMGPGSAGKGGLVGTLHAGADDGQSTGIGLGQMAYCNAAHSAGTQGREGFAVHHHLGDAGIVIAQKHQPVNGGRPRWVFSGKTVRIFWPMAPSAKQGI